MTEALDLLERVRRGAILRHLPLGDLDALVSRGDVVPVEHGVALIEEGSAAAAVFVLLEGQVAIRMALSEHEDVAIAVRRPGEIVGEMALIDGLPRSARVTAEGSVTVLRVPREAFVDAVTRSPEAALELVRVVSMRLRESDRAQLEALRTKAQELGSRNRLLARENRRLRTTFEERFGFERFLGESRAARDVRSAARRAAESGLPVLLVGETGTGKELLARAIHTGGERSGGPWVALNCALFREPLLESELFGHARGAFTGASGAKAGLVEAAHGGTLFLDELLDMPLASQAALLRFLELGEYRRLGETDVRRAEVRILAACHADPEVAAEEGRLRRDLLYRLDVFRIDVPPLRERPDDVPELARILAGEVAERHAAEPTVIREDALRALQAHPFPGNVRELRNEVERWFANYGPGAAIGADRLSPRLRGSDPWSAGSYADAVRAFKIDFLRRALSRAGGNRTAAARALGLHRSNLVRMIRDLELEGPAARRGPAQR